MAKVQFSLDGNAMGEYALDKERITIGRRKTNDIHIDNLAVSGEHAVIVTIGNDSFLEDLNSTNGTLVNNKPIKKHVLNHADVMELGRYKFIYINEKQAKSASYTSNSEFVNTMQVASNVPATASAEIKEVEVDITVAMQAVDTSKLEPPSPAAASLAEGAQITGKLQVLNGTSAGRELILNKAMTTLGKPGGQVAVVTKRPSGYFIIHVEGDNVPSVNGQMIGVQAYALNDQDVIELSGLKMQFSLA
jgi:pSer/pThr/pTyr-binding forkhead associated (FHA) protein